MFDFNIWYGGRIVDNLRADSLAKARNVATQMFSLPVVVTSLDATAGENDAAKVESAKLAG